MLKESEPAPNFTLPDQDGNPVSLANFLGKTVLVYFYPTDDTPACTKEACSLRDGMAEFAGKEAVILGISPDDAESHRKFRAKYQLPFSLLSDPDHRVMEAYGVWGEKNLYGHKYIGVLRTSFVIGPDGRIKKIFRRVVTATHAAQVIPFL